MSNVCKYARFAYIGPYEDLPQGRSRMMEVIRDPAAFPHQVQEEGAYIQHYANDASVAPPEELLTHIHVPIY